MADGYWRYSDARQPQSALPSLVSKRPRTDYDVPSGHELSSYYTRDDDRGALRGMRDTDSLGASYDRYLRSAQISSYSGGQSARHMSGGMPSRPVDDPRIVGIGGMDPGPSAKDRALGLGGGRSEVPLPPDASSTLFVEGLPSDCSRREPGGDPLILCFVDFVSPAHAATAMDALQGREKLAKFPFLGKVASLFPISSLVAFTSTLIDYAMRFDEHDRDSVKLRLQFARYPGARSGGGHRGKR
ncbi:hypothetical protein KPL71_008005 [Citrus sinensis]|uniref:Uncharacterized protein n=1 Tax=Citrus sinensis TaxID=2711 RepID=A0ACB8M407_CITSI|nr:hypothetical protein KPL71_008005 [Citrus sinensis]